MEAKIKIFIDLNANPKTRPPGVLSLYVPGEILVPVVGILNAQGNAWFLLWLLSSYY